MPKCYICGKPLTSGVLAHPECAENNESALNLIVSHLSAEPGRLRELAQADKEGRVVVLPCKAGDTVGGTTP